MVLLQGEMDWMHFPWTKDLTKYVKQITEPVDTILLDRKLAEGFIPHWESVAKIQVIQILKGVLDIQIHRKLFLPEILTSQFGTTLY